jgi:hypothetical protein
MLTPDLIFIAKWHLLSMKVRVRPFSFSVLLNIQTLASLERENDNENGFRHEAHFGFGLNFPAFLQSIRKDSLMEIKLGLNEIGERFVLTAGNATFDRFLQHLIVGRWNYRPTTTGGLVG